MTPFDDDVDVDALDRRFEAALARSREFPSELLPSELATLALPPFWTELALNEVFEQPGESEAVLAKAGRFLHVEGDVGRRVISLREPNAPAVIANLREHRDLGLWATIGSKIARITELPPVLSAWADLARQLGKRSDYDLSRELLARVAVACETGRPGDVQDLVEGAAALARGLGPPLSGAVRVAQHRIHRWYTVQRDRRKLAHFVPRSDALAALDRLLDDCGPAVPWALHYVGAAGMGKTSLIRHLMTEIAGRRRLQVARIDFDHLSPAYPAHEPGQLIASLAYEFTALIETESQDKLIGFVESAVDQLRGLAGLAGTDLHTLLDSREMQELMSWFGSLLQSFARPVLVLDTCEELTKLEITNGVIPSVEATFVMLDRLHTQAPQLRVVLAGRRLLAGAYANWAASDEIARRAGVTVSRPFMMLHELRGFDAAEARSYLDKRLPLARRTDEPLIDKLLALSPEPLRVSALAAAPDSEPHYNPFDLSRYAEWVEADPGVQLAEFDQADIDPYVEVRIVQRMGELEPLLPALVLLRRFDLPMLATALPPGGNPQAIFEKLARHEWLRTTNLGERTVLEADRGLPARIERCIAASRGAQLTHVRTQLGAALRRMVETGSLLEISVEVYDAALRLLPPDAAAALWRDIEARIGNEADWGWAAKLTRDLIAEGYAGEHANELVGLAIRATHASAIVHAGVGADLDTLWREIERGAASVHERSKASDPHYTARRGPGDASPAWLLRQRARLGRVAASAAAGTGGQAALVATVTAIAEELVRSGVPGALASSRCAAIEAVVELAERDPDRAAPELAALADHLAFDHPALAAFGGMLRARIDALVSLDARLTPVILDPVPELPATVFDWRPPDSLRDRLRLELVRRFELLDLSSDPADGWALREAAETWQLWADHATATIDGDRLRSAVITVLGSGVRTSATSAVDAATEARCAAHRQFPPLAFAHSRVALARGESSQARKIARQLPRPWAQRLSCEIARWTRLPEDLSEEIFIDGLDAETIVAIDAARAVVEGVAPRGGRNWLAMPARNSEELAAVVARGRDELAVLATTASTGSAVARARANVVMQELAALSRYTASPTASTPNTGMDELERLHPSVRGEALRLRLRGLALDGANLGAVSSERAVMTAIEEAELLDLRLPEVALRLFEWAAEGAARLALVPARLRATFGAWLAAMHAGDEEAAVRAAAALREQLTNLPQEEWPAYRQLIAQPTQGPRTGPYKRESAPHLAPVPQASQSAGPSGLARGLDQPAMLAPSDANSPNIPGFGGAIPQGLPTFSTGIPALQGFAPSLMPVPGAMPAPVVKPASPPMPQQPPPTEMGGARMATPTRLCPYCGAAVLMNAPACGTCGRPMPPTEILYSHASPLAKTMFGHAAPLTKTPYGAPPPYGQPQSLNPYGQPPLNPYGQPPPNLYSPPSPASYGQSQQSVMLQPSGVGVMNAYTGATMTAATRPTRRALKRLPWIGVVGVIAMSIWLWRHTWAISHSPEAAGGGTPKLGVNPERHIAYVSGTADADVPDSYMAVDAGVSEPHMVTDAGVLESYMTADAGVSDSRADTTTSTPDSGTEFGVLVIGGVLSAGGLLIAGGLLVARKKRVSYPMPLPVSTRNPTQPSAVAAASSSDPQPRTIIVVAELSANMTEVAIKTRPATGKTIHGKASIGARGVWPELVDRSLEPALAALTEAAHRDSIALELSSPLAPRCWEGTLYNLIPHAVSKLAFHRVLPASQAQRTDLKPAQVEADGSLGALLAHAWKDRPGIVHVARRFSRTRQGDVQLTIDFSRDVSASSVQPVKHLELAEAQLLIVQCDPSMAEISTWASASESELAREYVIGALRRVSACGLVIPAIPARLLEEFTARLVAGIGGCTRAELIEAARELRAYLHDHGCAAYELTLFLREAHQD